jgi:hypothetical protein
MALENIMTATSVIQLLEIVQGHVPETMYRGQSNIRWKLLPSLARFAKYVEGGYDRIGDLESHLLDQYLQCSVPLQDMRELSLIEQLIHCQHYGLPTRLLDWSTNPLKALYFAVENPMEDNFDGVVYVMQAYGWWEGTRQIREIKTLSAFFPELLNERLSAQDGCFVAFPLPESGMEIIELTDKNYSKEVEFLYSVKIPKRAKREIRRQLAVLGITHRTIYPGLDGVAKWVKSNLSNFQI